MQSSSRTEGIEVVARSRGYSRRTMTVRLPEGCDLTDAELLLLADGDPIDAAPRHFGGWVHRDEDLTFVTVFTD